MERRGSTAYRRDVKTTKYTILAITSVVVCLVIIMAFKSIDLWGKILNNEKQIEQIERKIEEEQQRTIEIDGLADYVKTDEYIEQTAREKMGMIKDGEIVFEEY